MAMIHVIEIGHFALDARGYPILGELRELLTDQPIDVEAARAALSSRLPPRGGERPRLEDHGIYVESDRVVYRGHFDAASMTALAAAMRSTGTRGWITSAMLPVTAEELDGMAQRRRDRRARR